MRRVLSALALSACAVLGTTAVAHAQSPCDAYSGTCVEGTKHVKGGKSPEVKGTKQGLPFTGAEVTGLAAAGLAAVGGGTVLVLAGRRKRAVVPA